MCNITNKKLTCATTLYTIVHIILWSWILTFKCRLISCIPTWNMFSFSQRFNIRFRRENYPEHLGYNLLPQPDNTQSRHLCQRSRQGRYTVLELADRYLAIFGLGFKYYRNVVSGKVEIITGVGKAMSIKLTKWGNPNRPIISSGIALFNWVRGRVGLYIYLFLDFDWNACFCHRFALFLLKSWPIHAHHGILWLVGKIFGLS